MSCSRKPIVAPRRTLSEPESGSERPARILKRVVLPDPFGPISAMRSRGPIVKDTFSKRTCSPKDFAMALALSMCESARV
jgi:hypothetical protein